jgi:integrase/recombinase XerD
MKQAKTLSQDELSRLVSVVKDGKYGVRDTCLVYLSFYLGLRVKEMSSLLTQDIINQDGSLVESFYLTPEQSKTDGRTIYLTNKIVRKSLTEYLNWREVNKITSSRLFWTQKEGSFNPNTLQMLFSRMYQRAGLKGCSSHSGRRTFATNLIQKGFDIKSVSVLMGHSNVSITSRYLDTNPVSLGNMCKAL